MIAQSPPSNISVRWLSDQTVEVTGLSKTTLTRLRNWQLTDWQGLLRVQVAAQAQASLPSMLGTYRIEASSIHFKPQYPLQPGLAYQATFRPAALPGFKGDRRELTAVFSVPARNLTPATTVTQIYPTASLVPENLLKFYVHFSAPMSRGQIYDHIRLLGADGKQVELPFLEIDEELWDDSMTRLTLFIDPGRIKRGVKPLEDVGPALEAGKSYSLVIDEAWHDGYGRPLKESFRKQFFVGAPDRETPDPAKWRLEQPAAGTREKMVVLFPEPMDKAVTQRVIHIIDASGRVVAGEIALADQERRWSFQPAGLWVKGNYQLVIQTTIEDLAGNNIGKPFDVDLFAGVQRRLASETVTLPFTIQ